MREVAGKVIGERLRRGDRVSVLTQGGGGLGDPASRDPEALRRDVREGKVSAAAAREYGPAAVELAS